MRDTGAPFRLALALCLAFALVGTACGDKDDEVMLGGNESATSPTTRDDERIERLEHRVARLKARTDESRRPLGTTSGLLRPGATESFSRLARSLDGDIGLAVRHVGQGSFVQLGNLQSGAAWSTIKVPIAARVIEDAGTVSTTTGALVASAITASDNAAAAELWEQLTSTHGGPSGAAAATGELLSAAGDSDTVVSTVGRDGFSPYGQTDWSLAGQTRFMSALAASCVAPNAANELRRLMGDIVSNQRWGLGAVGADAYFKGGWGPGEDGRYLVRQMGVVSYDRGAVAVAMAATADDGQLGTGTSALTSLAEWLVDHVAWQDAAPRSC